MRGHRRSPYAPLPGTTPSPRGLFLDLWGTLLETPEEGVVSPELEYSAGALDALFRAAQDDWLVYVVGNQDAVARGRLTDDVWHGLERDVLEHLAAHGIPVRRSYACIADPIGGRGKHRQDSVYRLPNTGAFYHASHFDGLELRRSWVIGDSTLELVAGWRAGLRTAGLASGVALSDRTFEVDPDLLAADLAHALDAILASTPSVAR